MMRTMNEAFFPCRPETAFRLASRLEEWPRLLPHYRWVRRRSPDTVEMAAWRAFGPLPWPVRWVSRVRADAATHTVRHTHIAGVTRGMEVVWRIEPGVGGSWVTILHEWADGPRFAGPAAGSVARRIIGPVFIHHVAEQTLRHMSRHARGGIQA